MILLVILLSNKKNVNSSESYIESFIIIFITNFIVLSCFYFLIKIFTVIKLSNIIFLLLIIIL